MRHIVDTGTDGAALCFFDAASLPPDFDAKVADDPVGLMEELQSRQELWCGGTGGDGGFIFHLYVEEDPPGALLANGREVKAFDRFCVRGGQLTICGAEYAANDPQAGSAFTPKGGLAKYTRMGGRVGLPPGEYAVRVWKCEWPREERERKLDARIPRPERRKRGFMANIGAICLFSGVLMLGMEVLFAILLIVVTIWNYFQRPYMLSRLPRLLTLWTLFGIAGGILAGIGYLIAKRDVHGVGEQINAIEREEMPDYVVTARRVNA